MQYTNPVISGFYPDPSVCRVGGAYYLVSSSFEYFPSIPIFKSEDLMNWEIIGHVIDEKNAIKLREGNPNRTGMYAPTIRYHKGMFYVVCTNVAYGDEDDGNFVVRSHSPYGPWSIPSFIDLPGIDPSLFFDDDGSVYYTGTHGSIYICRLDEHTLQPTEARKDIWSGTGGCAPEGPHLYKKNGWYYLLISEGGTEIGHMVTMARSKSPYGPYDACPFNPVLTNRGLDLPIKATGHADLFQDDKQHWWAVCLGIRTISYPFRHNLGRETMLVPVTWEDEWPVLGRNGIVDEVIHVGLRAYDGMIQKKYPETYDDFTVLSPLHNWVSLYTLDEQRIQKSQDGLKLYGNALTLADSKPLAWLGKRQTSHACSVETQMMFSPKRSGEEAGLSIYLNNTHHYAIALTRYKGQGALIFRRQVGSLSKVEAFVPYNGETVCLGIEATKETYTFRYREHEEGVWKTIGQGETQYLTTEVGGCFTGNFWALYAAGNGEECVNPSIFKWFKEIKNTF